MPMRQFTVRLLSLDMYSPSIEHCL